MKTLNYIKIELLLWSVTIIAIVLIFKTFANF